MALTAESQTTVICEGIRQEINNKFTLFGVFGHDINIASLPGLLSIALYAELKVNEVGEFLAELQFIDPRNKPIFVANIGVRIDKVGHITMPIGPFPAQITIEGTYAFRLKFEGGKWIKLKTIGIILNQGLAPPIPSVPFPVPVQGRPDGGTIR